MQTDGLKWFQGILYLSMSMEHDVLGLRVLSLRYNVEQLVGNYKDWSMAVGKGTTQVAILYSSDYGFSDRLSQTLARGVTKAGVATEMVDVLSVDPQVGAAVYMFEHKNCMLICYGTAEQ